MIHPVRSPHDASYARLHMPAEWQPHAACWMAWPGRTALPHGAERNDVLAALARIAHAVALYEPLQIVVDIEHFDEARRYLPSTATLHPMPVDDHWMRDTGPTFVHGSDEALHALCWNFNDWGNKTMPSRGVDAAIAAQVGARLSLPTTRMPIVAEGGALHVDGEGTLLVARTSILNDNRNPGLTQRDADDVFRHWLGVSTIVWVPGSTLDTITDGHIDGIACFVRPGVLLATAAQGNDTWARETRENLRALQLARDAQGRAFEIGLLHAPSSQALPDNDAIEEDFSAEYVNAYLANGAVLMPAFGAQHADDAARAVMAAAFPTRRIVQIQINAIARRGGGIHCCTQQQPMPLARP